MKKERIRKLSRRPVKASSSKKKFSRKIVSKPTKRSKRIVRIVPAKAPSIVTGIVSQEIKGKTFYVPQKNGHPFAEASQNLPFSYNETKLTLLPRDPDWAYGYWDFSAVTWDWIVSMSRADQGMRAVLRIYNIGKGGHYDIGVDLEAKNWYLHLGMPDETFEAELGLIDSKGVFHMIARSNRIRMPRNGPSKIIDPKWEPENFDELYRVSGGGSSDSPSSWFSSYPKKRKAS